MASNSYTEASIKTLSSTEHIRLRPGMYIGRLGSGGHAEDGIYVLIKETIDNSVDEFTMGCGRKIEVELAERIVRVRDYGRGTRRPSRRRLASTALDRRRSTRSHPRIGRRHSARARPRWSSLNAGS